MLVELSVMEQRYQAVMEVVSGAPVAEVARRYGVSRQAVHGWLSRYEGEGLAGLADHSRRPRFQPRQLDVEVEALICQLRVAHPRWGPRRLVPLQNSARGL
jgi:transposase